LAAFAGGLLQQFVMLGKTFKGLTATSHLRRRPTKAHRL